MIQKNKIRTALVAALIMILVMVIPSGVYAADSIRNDRSVSLSLSVKYDGEIVEGVEFGLYKLADYSGDGRLTAVDGLDDLGFDISSAEANYRLTYILAEYVQQKNFLRIDKVISGSTGQASFPNTAEDLPQGIYLVVADTLSKDGYTYNAAPLLISLPYYNEAVNSLEYNVNAVIKLSVYRGERLPEDTPVVREIPEYPTTPDRLPQTGLLWWPAPILLLLGIALIVIGGRSGRRHSVRYLGIAFIIVLFALIPYNLSMDINGKKASADSLKSLEIQLDQSESEADLSLDEIPAYEGSMPELESDGQKYIGILKINTLSLELPVISQWSYDALKISPARYAGSAYQDDMVIAAHNYNSHFGRIKDLQPGDTLSFSDVGGNDFAYRVREIEILGPTDVEEMTTGDWDLTLFTCTLGGASRVTVRCEKI